MQTKPTLGSHLLWLSLAACASIMFLATTNQICQDVAVVPFLWVLPLSLYLLSFIICFDEPRWYSRAVFHPAFAVAIFLACLLLLGWGIRSIVLQIAAYSFVLFACCMVCHGELARSKPALASPHFFLPDGGSGGRAGRRVGGIGLSPHFPRVLGIPARLVAVGGSSVRGAGAGQELMALLQPMGLAWPLPWRPPCCRGPRRWW